MEWANIKTIQVPDIGLKDGMLQALFEDHFEEIRPASDHSGRKPITQVQARTNEIE